MSPEAKAKVLAILATIKPGKNYPSSVEITENDPKNPALSGTVRFLLQSYIAGMYCAMHLPSGGTPIQLGDHNNKKFVTGLKKDILLAMERDTVTAVEIGSVRTIPAN